MRKRFNQSKKMVQSRLQKKAETPNFSKIDVFLISYPRSGNTWVRFLIANILKPAKESIDFHNVHDYVPEIGRNNDVINLLPSPRVIKSHALFQPSFQKVIYLVRDGRDVYVSYYYYRLKQIQEGFDFSDFLQQDDHYPSLWKDHVESWLKEKNPHSTLLTVRYEDLLLDTERELKRMVEFVGIEASDDLIQQAVEASKFDQMRAIDQIKGRKYNLTGTTNFVRKGQSGSWQDVFTSEDKAFFKERAGQLLIRLGYEKDLSW